MHHPWSRWRAAGIHLAVSIILLGTSAALAMCFWYPPSLFHVSGVDRLLMVLTFIDVTVGPLLTLLIYRAGKPGLHFDLTVIALLQAGFFLYGAHVFFAGRPIFLAAAVDRFELVFANEIAEADWQRAREADARWTAPGIGRPQLVGVVLPRNPTARSELLFEELSGRTAVRQPRLYRPYAEVARGLLAHARPADELQARPDTRATLDRALARSGLDAADVRWLPLDSSRGSAIQLVDARTGWPLAALAADPWSFPRRRSSHGNGRPE